MSLDSNPFDLNHRLNAPVVEYLRRGLTAGEREWPRFRVEFRAGEAVPIGELSTHPDLGLHLRELAPPETGSVWEVIAGCFALRSPRGVLYAVASGMRFLAFRVGPNPKWDSALGARREPGLGPDWAVIQPWSPEVPRQVGDALKREMARAALGFAEGLSADCAE